jgi:uncharacterized membrane protein
VSGARAPLALALLPAAARATMVLTIRNREGRAMSQIEPRPSEQPSMSDKQLAFIVYVLYFAAYFTGGITAIIGVVIAHAKVSDAEELTRSHYQFQIRTFWIGMLYLVVGVVLLFVFIGILVLVWLFFWLLIRNVKGLLALNDNRPIQDPTTWMF